MRGLNKQLPVLPTRSPGGSRGRWEAMGTRRGGRKRKMGKATGEKWEGRDRGAGGMPTGRSLALPQPREALGCSWWSMEEPNCTGQTHTSATGAGMVQPQPQPKDGDRTGTGSPVWP